MCKQRQHAKGKIDTLIQAIDRLSERLEVLVATTADRRKIVTQEDGSTEPEKA